MANSFVTRKSAGKVTKKDMKKGANSNLGAEGIHGKRTFEKYKSVAKSFIKHCFEHHDVRDLNDIKSGMYLGWLRDKMRDGQTNGEKYSARTIGLYVSAIKKFAESAEKTDYKMVTKLDDDKINRKIKEMKKEHGVQYRKSDYKRGKNVNGRLGYSLNEAQKIAKKGHGISPLHGTMLEVLTYAAPRHDELLHVKWRQIDFENNRIYLDDPNQTKTARPRFVPITEKTAAKLQAIIVAGFAPNLDTRIWGSKMTESDVRKVVEHCCKEAKVGYGGIHDFRRSAVEYHSRELQKAYDKGKITKEDIARRFLQHVNEYPELNPIEPKMEKARDANGNVIYEQQFKSNGEPILKNGKPYRVVKWIPKRENGEQVRDHRYTLEELMDNRVNRLINMTVSQILGHNRPDATSPYKNG